MSSETSAVPALDVNDLNFDTCERLRHLNWLLEELGVGENGRVLDAGGYPCYMARAFPQRNVVTADIYANGHPPYVKASGAALPFPEGTFDVTIACDVLEHVPPVHRQAFLTELARVSSRAVIIAGPYTTPGAARAEATVRSLLPESSPAQMWLAEHTECGLPSMADTINVLSNAGAQSVRALPVGSLTEWMLFFAAQAAGERHYKVSETVQSFIAEYNRMHTWPEISYDAPAYRHAVVAALDADTHARLTQLTARTEADSPADPSARFDAEQVERYVDALGELLRAGLGSSSDVAKPGERPGGGASKPDSVTAEYITRLETMLSHRGMILPEPGSIHVVGADSVKRRLRNAWAALCGR